MTPDRDRSPMRRTWWPRTSPPPSACHASGTLAGQHACPRSVAAGDRAGRLRRMRAPDDIIMAWTPTEPVPAPIMHSAAGTARWISSSGYDPTSGLACRASAQPGEDRRGAWTTSPGCCFASTILRPDSLMPTSRLDATLEQHRRPHSTARHQLPRASASVPVSYSGLICSINSAAASIARSRDRRLASGRTLCSPSDCRMQDAGFGWKPPVRSRRSARRRWCWLALDEGDDDPVRPSRYAVAAFTPSCLASAKGRARCPGRPRRQPQGRAAPRVAGVCHQLDQRSGRPVRRYG